MKLHGVPAGTAHFVEHALIVANPSIGFVFV